MKLWAKLDGAWEQDSFVGRVTRDGLMNADDRANHVLLAEHQPEDGFAFVFLLSGAASESIRRGNRCSRLDPLMCRLEAGDVVRIRPRVGEVHILFRKGSAHNFLVPTTRCNEACRMCSQPFTGDDPDMFRDLMAVVPLLDSSVECLGISGGEPTLWGPRLVELVAALHAHLPNTTIDVLSNATLLRYYRFAADLAHAWLPQLRVGVPIHSDSAMVHDEVTGKKGSFDQTILGLLNLQRCGVPVEIRVILQTPTLPRLVELARFIVANLCFASHVAFMGLERAGRAVPLWDELWVAPHEHRRALLDAVNLLVWAGMSVSVYNLPLCVLDPGLRPVARQSISDWKNDFPPTCNACGERSRCAGFFGLEGNPLVAAARPLPLA
jgi:His-Xaa-Ser system radical SAM maturase HxsC